MDLYSILKMDYRFNSFIHTWPLQFYYQILGKNLIHLQAYSLNYYKNINDTISNKFSRYNSILFTKGLRFEILIEKSYDSFILLERYNILFFI